MPDKAGLDARACLAHTDALIDQARARLDAFEQARNTCQRALALLVQAPGNAPAFWLKLGHVDAAGWQAGAVRLPLGPVRVGECYFAYANGAGAVGMLEVTLQGAQWRLRAPRLADAVPPARLKQALGLQHPSRTVAPMTSAKANALFELLATRLTGSLLQSAGSQSV